jgi:hypothetical protein
VNHEKSKNYIETLINIDVGYTEKLFKRVVKEF